jgi:hypothetical protein
MYLNNVYIKKKQKKNKSSRSWEWRNEQWELGNQEAGGLGHNSGVGKPQNRTERMAWPGNGKCGNRLTEETVLIYY